MKIILLALALALALFLVSVANSAPLTKDAHYCFGEPSLEQYSDVIICLNLDTSTTWAFNTISWSISGLGWNRIGGVAALSGAINTGKDENYIPSYFIHFITSLNQHIQEVPEVVPYYLIIGNMVINQSKLGVIAPSNDRFNPNYVIGVSYRQDIMLNANLVTGECTLRPYLCWDTMTGFDPKKVVRYSENDLPFLPLFER